MFIAPDEKIAREVAKNNGFKVTDETVFEDVTVEKTEIDKLHEDTIVE